MFIRDYKYVNPYCPFSQAKANYLWALMEALCKNAQRKKKGEGFGPVNYFFL